MGNNLRVTPTGEAPTEEATDLNVESIVVNHIDGGGRGTADKVAADDA